MNRLNKLEVFYHNRLVGTMALYKNRLAAFEYSNDWLKDGFSISPFSLPLKKKVFMPKIEPFEDLFGVFADSLPDGCFLLHMILLIHTLLVVSMPLQ